MLESDETNNRGVRDGLTVSGANPPAPPWTPPAMLAGAAQKRLSSLSDRRIRVPERCQRLALRRS